MDAEQGTAVRARLGRHPKTGAAAAIPARRVVRFVGSQMLQQAVAEVGSPADCASTRLPRARAAARARCVVPAAGR